MDGLDSSQFLRSDAADTATGTITFDNGADILIYGNIGSNGSTTFGSMTGRLRFDNDYSDTARGPNKIVLQNDNNWISGFGVHNNVTAHYTGSTHVWYRSTSPTSYTQQLSLDSSGNLTAVGNVKVPDSSKFLCGDGDDLQIYHDGTHSYVQNNTNDLLLSANYIKLRSPAGENCIVTNFNGAVELYYDNSKKLDTTTTGITVTGDVNSTSDINLKKDIEVISKPIDLLNEIEGVKFTWKETETQSVGVIAQDVEEVLPELVNGDDGEKSVNYSGLVGVLIEAVKEQQKQIETLTKRIEELEG